jgi:antitoxin VapB
MPLNIKNAEVERLITDIADRTGETKTETVRRALEERKSRLAYRVSGSSRSERLKRFLEQEVWPRIPKKELGRALSRKEQETILGFGKDGV